ncbi:MAG: SpoIID/LytB domain-containing protein [Solirubrobacterales bacterium]|nr:SpoIID/LytB domain-containing protein [Solirubrobacterales bacterium]
MSRPSLRPTKLTLGVLSSAALLFVAGPAPAGAETRFDVVGAGFGHGVGLSQWGAYGYAKHGEEYRDIATHYFTGAKIDQVRDARTIRVLLDTTTDDVSFSHSKRACGQDLKPSATYRAALSGSGVRLERSDGKRIAGCGESLDAKASAGPIQIGGQGAYRGDFVASASGGTLYIVNQVNLDDYVQGVIPNEMSSSWPLAALQAQAVAARSYALATDAGSGVFDQYDDTRSQVYGGLATESTRTNVAVRKSKLQVLEYRDEVIPAFYSSSSGGRTENVEFGFPGAEPKPYLRSVKDPYDDASPDHRWRESFTQSEMQSQLSGLVKGRLESIKVTKRGVSPRIVEAEIVGTAGTTSVTGSDLQSRLGLRSTWAKFTRVR